MTIIDSTAPGFIVIQGNRLEDLGARLVALLKTEPLPPLTAEVILVPSNGVKHWLEMTLAADAALGICAAVSLEQPGGFLWRLCRQVLGGALPRQMPFEKDSLAWRLFRLLPELADSDPVYAPLQRYLAGSADSRKRYQLAMQLASVFDSYQNHRADWLERWAAGDDGALDAAQRWQAHLWRAIVADVGPALADASRALVHERFISALKAHAQAGTLPPGLPQRVTVFGVSSLSVQEVGALAALGQFCQVRMLVQSPCRYRWLDQAGAGHPLLASWGRQAREHLQLIDAFAGAHGRQDAFQDMAGAAPTQLAQLQCAILEAQPLLDKHIARSPDDTSVTLASTHSPQREVEVLHDQLLAWFDADPALAPRDVIVLVPDMEAFAPHIHAVFGRFAAGKSARHIPYCVADATARQSPLVRALASLLALPDARVTLADWLALFGVAAVRRRFGVSEADVAQLQQVLDSAAVRWGLDAAHRCAWGVAESVPDRDQNTWAFGLRRLLLGYAVGADGAWCGVLPQPGIGGLDAALVGRLLDWLDAISVTLGELSQPRTALGWCRTIGAVAERFFEATDDTEERLISSVLAPLDEWLRLCEEAHLDQVLPLDVVREHWLGQIEQLGVNQRPGGRGVQFAGLLAMRSIPFKVVCLLGMNDGEFPRQAAPSDFDLTAQDWRAGDRSQRADDRYLFLETILAAREKLYISWQGRRVTDNADRPPSVLVAQLIDHLDAGWTPPVLAPCYPLQPFSLAYFTRGSPFATYDDDWALLHAGAAQAKAQQAVQATTAPVAVTLKELQQFLRQPAEVFFRHRLGIWLDKLDDRLDDNEPFSLDNLQTFILGQEILAAPDPVQASAAMALSGRLPMAAFGARQAAEFDDALGVLLERRAPWLERFSAAAPPMAIDLQLAGMALTGSLDALCGQQADGAGHLQLGQRLSAITEGKGKNSAPKGYLLTHLWVAHLAACASGAALTSVQLGLDNEVVFAPLEKQASLAMLERLAGAYREAWLRPLPVACKTALAFLCAQEKAERDGASGKEPCDPHEEALAAFEGGQFPELAGSPYLARAFDSYEDIATELPAWAQLLYGDMTRHLRMRSDEDEAS